VSPYDPRVILKIFHNFTVLKKIVLHCITH